MRYLRFSWGFKSTGDQITAGGDIKQGRADACALGSFPKHIRLRLFYDSSTFYGIMLLGFYCLFMSMYAIPTITMVAVVPAAK